MPKRETTPKMFLSYASRTTKTAEGFLQAYEQFLTTGELASKTSPVLAQVKGKGVTPEIGLQTIKNICTMHILKKDELAAEQALMNNNGMGTPKSDKPITATIYLANGEVATHMVGGEEKPLVAHFDHPQNAERWMWNKLDAGGTDWYGEAIHVKVTIGGEPMKITATRDEALRGLKKAVKTPFLHVNKVSVPTKPKMKVSGSHQRFSHG